MLPITRANLDNICCTCLVDIRPTNPANKNVYIIQEKINLLKVLKVTAYVTVLKDPSNLKYINDYCRKLCKLCFLKAQYSYNFLQKIIDSTTLLKDLLKSDSNSTIVDVKVLRDWCRICLNRQMGLRDEDHNKYIKWLKMFSGIENDELLNNNEHCPKQLCGTCLEKLRNVEEYWLLSTYSFKYIASEINKDCGSRVDTKYKVYNEPQAEQSMIVNENLLSQSYNKDVQEVFTIKYEEESTQYQETVMLCNKIIETTKLPEDSNIEKDEKKHFTGRSIYSTDCKATILEPYANGNNLAIEEGDDDIDYDFVIVNAEE